MDADPDWRRRSVLGGVGGLVLLAGCGDDEPTDGNGAADDTGTDGRNDDGNETDDDGSGSESESEERDESQSLIFGNGRKSWPRSLTDPRNGGYDESTTDVLTEFTAGPSIEDAVETNLPSYVLQADRLYSAFRNDALRAFDIDGAERWDRSTDVSFGPFVEDDDLHLITSDDQLVRIDAETGDQEWIRSAPDGWEYIDVHPEDGTLYAVLREPASDYRIGTYDIEDDSVAWESAVVDERAWELALADGAVVVRESGSVHQGVRVFDVGTDEPRWQTDVDVNDVMIGGDTVYALQTPGNVDPENAIHAVSLADGDVNWSMDADDQLDVETTVTDEERVYHATEDGYTARGSITGEVEWTVQLEEPVRPGPYLTDDALYLPEASRLHVIDPATGDELAIHTVERVDAVGRVTGHRDRIWFEGDDLTDGSDLIALREP